MEMRYLIKGIHLPVRLAAFAAIEAVGVVVQTAILATPLPGTIIMIAGLFLLWAKGYSNKPEDLGYENWKPASFREVQRIRVNLQRTKKNNVAFFYKPVAMVLVIFPGAALLIVSLFLSAAFGRSAIIYSVLDTILISLPLVLSGLVRLWTPRELAMKLNTFYPLLVEELPEDMVITPYLRFDQDKEGREIPEDLRIMIELKRNPDDFVGVQLQAAINSGPNGPVPYLYAVFLCKGKASTYRRIAGMEFGRYVKEAEGDDEFGTIVVRQQTGGKGYHTTRNNCKQLFEMIVGTLNELKSV
jgi:hypothetical protein